ncbi:peroxiredoxin-like family protein [Thalassotalea fusca]
MIRLLSLVSLLLMVSMSIKAQPIFNPEVGDNAGQSKSTYNIAETVDDIKPLLNGQFVPDVQVKTSEGKLLPLRQLVAKQKTILFFYRGGWCPFCNTQMGQLKAIEKQLANLGYQLIGVSTDSTDMLQKSIKDKALGYQLLSDFESELSQAFGLAYFATAKTTKRYLNAMDLKNPLQKNATGESRLVLPAPAVYVINTDGLVTFSYVNTNYKVRLDEQVLLSVAKHM